MFPQSILDEIKDRVSISALIGERVPLKKAGRNFKGCCPFHSEKTASFMVSDEKQIYHCFGCGEGGNVFNFFMKFDGLSFKEAVESLAARAGVRLPVLKPSDREKEDAATVKKKWAYRLNEVVSEYFQKNLKDPKKGEEARNYLKSRNIFFEKNAQHFLGYADDSWDGLVRFLNEKKAPLELAAELGLLKKRDGGGYYDFFRHRVMFPVMIPSAGAVKRVVAFSGRTFGKPKTAEGREEPAKYLNSPDSVIYHKSYTVFGLQAASDLIRRNDFVILVEGNLDVVRLHQEGLGNTVAPLGTALTSGHIKLLSRLTKHFVVIFDGDDAGRKAAVRSLPLFLEEGLVPRVVVLEKGEDPDSFVAKNGAKALLEKIRSSPTLFEWVIDDNVKRLASSTDGKVKVVEELKPYFAMIKNAVESAQYKKRLAKLLLLDESVISESVRSTPKRTAARAAPVEMKGGSLERTVLELLLSFPDEVKEAAKGIDPSQFHDGSWRTVASLLLEELKKEGRLHLSSFVDGLADAEVKKEVLSLAMADGKYEDPVEAFKECVGALKRADIKRKVRELTLEMSSVPNDDAKLALYMSEIQKLTKELHNIGTESK